MNRFEKRLSVAGREFILVGTAHISRESINDVTTAIREEKPDCVAIELDDQRLSAIKNPDSWKRLDITEVLKKGQGFVLMANLVLSSFQRKMGSDVGVQPGEEMKAAITVSEELGIKSAMVDRPIKITLQRAWAKNSFIGKCKLLAMLFSSAFFSEEISGEEIENLKNTNEMDSLMAQLSDYLPTIKSVLIDERDKYLASKIWQCDGNKTLAVLGAGHLNGVIEHLENIASGAETTDVSEIEIVPPKTFGTVLLGALFPIAIIGVIVLGFVAGGLKTSLDMLVHWVLWNGSLAALGALLAGGHILSVLVGFLGAPIATLNPFLGVGMFTGLTQAWIKRPKVGDVETLNEDILSLRGIYRNRILRVLLVFFVSSIGGIIGNAIVVPSLISQISQIIQ
ncbi:MAG: TraB/GumN family protein [Treponemataceae bacterium]|nr:MAG: TraB/GumN family protein [Treponemataceae bacterium]